MLSVRYIRPVFSQQFFMPCWLRCMTDDCRRYSPLQIELVRPPLLCEPSAHIPDARLLYVCTLGLQTIVMSGRPFLSDGMQLREAARDLTSRAAPGPISFLRIVREHVWRRSSCVHESSGRTRESMTGSPFALDPPSALIRPPGAVPLLCCRDAYWHLASWGS